MTAGEVGGNTVSITAQSGIATVRLDRPPANAVDLVLARELLDALTRLEHQADVSAVILTGTGECFCAGLDLKVVPSYDRDQQRDMLLTLAQVVLKLYALPLPTIAAVNGHAVAAGTLFALATDYRIAPTGTCQFGLTGVRVGIPYPTVAMTVIERELDPVVRRVMLLGARTFVASEALSRGIVDELKAPKQVMPRAVEVAHDMMGMPRDAYARTKRQIRHDAIARMEATLTGEPDPLTEGWIGQTSGNEVTE